MTADIESPPRVLIIGGGSTGCGIARDLSQRGVSVILVERGNLTHGTTGRMHGLLHSGARYAVSDPASAKECIDENRILRNIAGHCIEETGGLFVKQPTDSASYFDEKVAGCQKVGIPVTILSSESVQTREPLLASDIERAIAVPDAAIDPFRLCVANALDAESNGASILTHTTVTDIILDENEVTGVEVEYGADTVKRCPGPTGQTEVIDVDHVINATGAWVGKIASLAELDVSVRPSKGVMTVTNIRQVDTVINRCRPKGDADIIVPHETTCILGTTDEEIADPDDITETHDEVEFLIDELAEVIPKLADARTLRSFWGVRPLYDPSIQSAAETTDISRGFHIIDHAQRDGLEGMTTIVGGKLTTYRLMAEKVANHVCTQFKIDAKCKTAETPLPGSDEIETLHRAMDEFGLRSPITRRSHERLGSYTDEILSTNKPNPVICECEAVTAAEVQHAINNVGSDLNAVRIRTRASMGNCQGCFCIHRMGTLLADEYDAETIAQAQQTLISERWRGQRFALWGMQLAQAMLSILVHDVTMNQSATYSNISETIPFDAYDTGPMEAKSSPKNENDGS